MLATIQFPISDIRRFTEYREHRINKPNWPIATEGSYVRCMGRVYERKRSGFPSWLGENRVCNAKNCIRFLDGFDHLSHLSNSTVKVAFRRFYFDAFISGKLELGLNININSNEPIDLDRVINDILNIEVNIPISKNKNKNKNKNKKLVDIRKDLKELYGRATTYNKYQKNSSKQLYMISNPSILIEMNKDEKIKTGLHLSNNIERCKTFLINGSRIIHLYYKTVNNENIKTWIQEKGSSNLEYCRALRVTLSRLHNAFESLQFLIHGSESDQLKLERGTPQFDNLQRFFNEEIDLYFHVPEELKNERIFNDCYVIERQVMGGHRNDLAKMISGFRRQVKIKAEKQYQTIVEQTYINSKVDNRNNMKKIKNEVSVENGSNIIVGSKVDGSSISSKFNNDSKSDESLTLALEKLGNYIESIKDKDNETRMQLFDLITRELGSDEPNSASLKVVWEELKKSLNRLPDIAEVASAIATIGAIIAGSG